MQATDKPKRAQQRSIYGYEDFVVTRPNSWRRQSTPSWTSWEGSRGSLRAAERPFQSQAMLLQGTKEVSS